MQRTNISMADRTTNRAKTARDAGLWAAIQVADQAAIKAEGEWGIGRLERIVPPELAAKFAIARHQLDEAISTVDIELAGQKAMAMARGWEALDRAARAGGYRPEDNAMVWFHGSPSGKKRYAFAKSVHDIPDIAKRHPDHIVISFDEIVGLFERPDAMATIAEIKRQWPGAYVQNKNPVNTLLNDHIPF
jgi:hypothetical protein